MKNEAGEVISACVCECVVMGTCGAVLFLSEEPFLEEQRESDSSAAPCQPGTAAGPGTAPLLPCIRL